MLVRRVAAVLLLSLATAHAASPAPASVMIDDLTWTELKARIDAGATTAIIPIGGTEQSGPHMALGKHNARVRLLAERVARELGNALVAPVVAYVPEGDVEPPTAHMRFTGTISIPERAFDGVLEGAARSLRRHGFRDIVFLGDHGGYQKNERAVAANLNKAWAGSPARAHAITEYYRAVESAFAATLRKDGYSDAEIGTHAGLADTSLTLALEPSLVRTDRMAAPPSAADGVYGDPRRSSAALGRAGADAIVAATVAAIRAAVARR